MYPIPLSPPLPPTHKCMHFWWCLKRPGRNDKSVACRREDVGFHFWLEEVKRNAWLREEESSRWQVRCIKRIFHPESSCLSWKRGRSEDARRSQSSLDFNELAFSVVTDFAQQLEREQNEVTFKNFVLKCHKDFYFIFFVSNNQHDQLHATTRSVSSCLFPALPLGLILDMQAVCSHRLRNKNEEAACSR